MPQALLYPATADFHLSPENEPCRRALVRIAEPCGEMLPPHPRLSLGSRVMPARRLDRRQPAAGSPSDRSDLVQGCDRSAVAFAEDAGELERTPVWAWFVELTPLLLRLSLRTQHRSSWSRRCGSGLVVYREKENPEPRMFSLGLGLRRRMEARRNWLVRLRED